jgi:hypothetical protein
LVVVFSSDNPKSDTNNDKNSENDGLVLDGLDQQMNQMASKYSFAESDFLRAAKERAAKRVDSHNSSAKDEDWKELAEQKKVEIGEIDDWENSQKEAGNEDSQILMFTDDSTGGEGGDDDGEPKLLLF